MSKVDFLKRRVESRELLMQLIYQMGITDDYSDSARKKFISEHVVDKKDKLEPDYKYFNKLLKSFISNKDKIDEIISTASDNWKIDRISKVDIAILRLSVTEILFSNSVEISEKVSINEAVELAKIFGSEKSPSFINGLRGRIVREEAENDSKTN